MTAYVCAVILSGLLFEKLCVAEHLSCMNALGRLLAVTVFRCLKVYDKYLLGSFKDCGIIYRIQLSLHHIALNMRSR